MASFAAILIVSWLLALILTPIAIRWASMHGWLDRPCGRKQHSGPVPLLGGVAVFGSAALALALLAPTNEAIGVGLSGGGSLIALGGGISVMLALGVYDDRWDLHPALKLSVQIWIGAATWIMGFRCGAIELPFGWIVSAEPLASFLITVLWIIIVTNGFNLIDGLDGLAAGIAFIASLTVFVLATGTRATVPVVSALALAGALAGFLRYNIPPARIFLGDAGSMALGYSVAVLSLASYQKGPTAAVLIVPLLVLGVPLVDTTAAIVRRLAGHFKQHGWRSLNVIEVTRAVFRADRAHIHHLLLRSGWGVRRVLFSLYAISAALAALALWSQRASSNSRWLILLGLVAVSVVVLSVLERAVLRRERSAQEPRAQSKTPNSRSERRAAG